MGWILFRDLSRPIRIGEAWIFEAVQHKFHACCHGTHATLEALGSLIETEGLTKEDTASVTVTVHPMFLKVCNIATPMTGLEAKFSLRQTAAMVLAGNDTAALSSFTDEICVDPGVSALRDKVTVTTDDNRPETFASVRVGRHAGTDLEASHDIDAQLALETRERKVRKKAAALLGSEKAEACWDRVVAMSGSTQPFALTDLTNI